MLRRGSIGLTVLLGLTPACQAAAATPREIFEEAVHLDLVAKTKQAFESYLKAARLGLPEAEFNVAVMLDSGRGIRQDVRQAAVWYARAATHGNRRAAYNLALLYAKGDGVPKNEGLSDAWFAASGLPASSDRLHKKSTKDIGQMFKLPAPTPVAPRGGTEIASTTSQIEIVWTADAPSDPVHYVVEVRSVDSNSRYVDFSKPVATSSLVVNAPAKGGAYAWRVYAVSRMSAQYRPSAWTAFRVVGDRSVKGASKAAD